MSTLVPAVERISCLSPLVILLLFTIWCPVVVFHMVQPRAQMETTSCCHSWLTLLLFYMICSYHPLYGTALCPDWRESAAVTPGYFTAVFLPGVQLSSSRRSSLVSDLRESATVTSSYFTAVLLPCVQLLFSTWSCLVTRLERSVAVTPGLLYCCFAT
jgi:hypothetical protein